MSPAPLKEYNDWCYATVFDKDSVTYRSRMYAGGVRTPIALHCGSSIFSMGVKAAEIGRFWPNIPLQLDRSFFFLPYANIIWFILNGWKYFLYLFVAYSMVLKEKRNPGFFSMQFETGFREGQI